MCTFSMWINKNEKLPTSNHLDYFSTVQGSLGRFMTVPTACAEYAIYLLDRILKTAIHFH